MSHRLHQREKNHQDALAERRRFLLSSALGLASCASLPENSLLAAGPTERRLSIKPYTLDGTVL